MNTKKDLHRSVGQYLRDKRIESGLTQAKVAEDLGYSTPQFISNIERGLCSPPLKNLRTLVRMYRIPVDEIMVIIMKEQEAILRQALGNKKKKTRRAR